MKSGNYRHSPQMPINLTGELLIDNFAGGKPFTKSKQVAMCGNSVCPPIAEALVRANMVEAEAGRVAA